MLCVNKKLYEERNIYSFIQASVLQLNRQNPYLIYKKEYRLFYYIAEDFCANMNFLSNYDITMDAFGFPVIKKNTRNAIEAFLDLYNLCCDDMYIDVLMYNAKKRREMS